MQVSPGSQHGMHEPLRPPHWFSQMPLRQKFEQQSALTLQLRPDDLHPPEPPLQLPLAQMSPTQQCSLIVQLPPMFLHGGSEVQLPLRQ